MQRQNAEMSVFDEALIALEPLWARALDAGVPRRIELAPLTLKDCILANVACRQDDTHLVYRGRHYTFAETNKLACCLANELLARGIHKGDAICIMLGDIPEFVISYMACYKIGCVAVGVNPRSTSDEVARCLFACEAQAMIVTRVRACFVAKLIALGTQVRFAFTVDNAAGTKESDWDVQAYSSGDATEGVVPFCDLYKAVNCADSAEPAVEISPGDSAVLIYTGGTTGLPKACPLTHSILIWAQYFFFSNLRPRLKCAQRMTGILTSPMTHAYGLNFGVNWGLVCGATVVLADALDGAHIASLIQENRVHVWGAVPALLNEVVLHTPAQAFDLSALEVVVVSCTVTSPEIFKRFQNRCPKAAIVEDYGMTETGGPVALTPVRAGVMPGSVGIPVANTDILIVDTKTGACPLKFGERGEIIFRGPQTIKGYFKEPEEAAHTFRDSWVYSGDIGYFSEDGALFVAGRIKEVIEVNGFSVFPREIDDVLLRHPSILDACTIGVPDAHAGERPKSFIVVRQGVNLTEKEIIDYCREHLIAYKCPRAIALVKKIPLTLAGKQNKQELQRRENMRDTNEKE